MATQTATTDESASKFSNPRGTVPVGDKYGEYESENGTIRRGDIVVFDDRDVPYETASGRMVHSQVFIGFVESICDMNRGGVELFISAGIGRVSVDDPNVGIRGEGIDTTDQMGVDSQIEQFIKKANITGREDDPVSASDVSEYRVRYYDGTVDMMFD